MVQLVILLLVLATATAATVGGAFSSVTTTTAGVGRRAEAGSELLAVAQKIELGLSASGLQDIAPPMSIADVTARQQATVNCGRNTFYPTAAGCALAVSPISGGGVVSSNLSGTAKPVVDMRFDPANYPWVRVVGGACEQALASASTAQKCTGGLMVIVPKNTLTSGERRRLDSAVGKLRAFGLSCSTDLTLELGLSGGMLWGTATPLPANGSTLTCRVRA